MLSLLTNRLVSIFKKRYQLFSIAVITATTITAQQTPQFSQFIQNPFVINPAITGTEDYSELTVAHRNQWAGLEGAPKTTSFTLNTTVANLKKPSLLHKKPNSRQGLGIFIYSDEAGPLKQSTFSASYAYHIKVSNDWHISLGTFLGFNQFSFDDRNVVLVQDQNDNLVQNFSSINFDLSLGIYAYSKYLFTGLAANQILNNPVNSNSDLMSSGSLQTTYNALIGSRISIQDNYQFVPFALAKTTVGAPIQWELGSKLIYKNNFWGGISYRNQDAIIVFLGFKFLEKATFNYSYDASTTAFNSSQNGTHEILIGYRFSFKKQSCNCPIYSL